MGTVKADDFQNSAGTGAPKFSKGIDLSQAAGFTKRKISSITSNTTLTSTDGLEIILADATSGAITVTLPAASSSSGRTLTIKKTDSSTNLITVDGNASETIDGDLTKKIGFQYDFMQISCDGSNWHIVDENRKILLLAKGNGGNTSLTKGVDKTISSMSITSDPYGMFTNGGSFVIKESGFYEITFNAEIELNVTASGPNYVVFLTRLLLLPSTLLIYQANDHKIGDTGTNFTSFSNNIKRYFTAGDTIEPQVYVDYTGGTVNARQTDNSGHWQNLSVIKI